MKGIMDGVLLIAGCDNPVAADFALHSYRRLRGRVAVVAARSVLDLLGVELIATHSLEGFCASNLADSQIRSVVVFLERGHLARQRTLLEELVKIVAQQRIGHVCVVSSFLVHFGDQKSLAAEQLAREVLTPAGARIVVIRPSHLLSNHAPLTRVLQRLGTCLAAMPDGFRSCCVRAETLFSVIEQELNERRAPRGRTLTVLGPNRPWNALARERGPQRILQKLGTLLLRLYLAGWMVAVTITLLGRRLPRLRSWSFDTLHPNSPAELLALYHKHNSAHVKIVGYNNGVSHFGHRYPGKTIVSTIACSRPLRVRGSLAKCDAGVTIQAAMRSLRALGKELHVLPNYSYVSLGTSFFVPIHGSACDYSTIGETIEKVLLFDPARDRFVVARRNSTEFSQYMYNLDADVLLLRLYLRVKPKSFYYVQQQKLTNPLSADVVNLFHDHEASNVELRKAGSAASTVTVSKYYVEAPASESSGLEVPRDRLGSLWDRLEENRLTSLLFHGLTRRFAHHVELFLSEPEFAVFWQTHESLPIKKIQLRYIKRDGLPHSPFAKDDCISADLFMLKKHRGDFDAYLKENFGTVRMNPGKHSM
jgi:hypothetical protein